MLKPGFPAASDAWQKAARRFPRSAACVDWLRLNNLWTWNGPLNGQVHRQRIARELGQNIAFDLVLETGTFRGASTEYLAAVSGAHVHTVEAQPRFYYYACKRFAGLRSATVHLGDSRSFLREMAQSHRHKSVLIYLDAHWKEDLPLLEELEIILANWSKCVIMIDDFQVPGDPGYGYDDYGPGGRLTAEYLPDDTRSWGRFYPSLSSKDETGAKRGCIVLVSPALLDSVETLSSLVRSNTSVS